ncbi:hypothetical protein RI367_001861 [Sorochytrium milnesiophthora]
MSSVAGPATNYSRLPTDEVPSQQRHQPRRIRSAWYDGYVILAAVFMPPLAVFAVKGCGAEFLINLLLTALGMFPGHIHAFYIVFKYPHEVMGVTPEQVEDVERAIGGGQNAISAPPHTHGHLDPHVVVVRPSTPQGDPTCGYSVSPNHYQAHPTMPSHQQQKPQNQVVEYPPAYEKR